MLLYAEFYEIVLVQDTMTTDIPVLYTPISAILC